MPFQSLPPAQRQRKQHIVVLIVVIWMIMTVKAGSAWLTPTEVVFVALLLGQPLPAYGKLLS